MINHLETRPASRYDEWDPAQHGNQNTRFADLIIDGKSLYQRLKKHDMVPSLGWGPDAQQRRMIDFFLLRQTHEYLYYRYPILVCPWCADEECGFISVHISREEDIVTWEDFRLESGNRPLQIGPFYFEWDDYERAIHDTFGMGGKE